MTRNADAARSDEPRIRHATDAALELARSGMSPTDATLNVAARFELDTDERATVTSRVTLALRWDELPADAPARATCSRLTLESIRATPDEAAVRLQQCKGLRGGRPSASNLEGARHLAAMIGAAHRSVADCVECARACGLLAGADLERADRAVEACRSMQTQAESIVHEIGNELQLAAFGSKAGA